jgi:hypothetical protein
MRINVCSQELTDEVNKHGPSTTVSSLDDFVNGKRFP